MEFSSNNWVNGNSVSIGLTEKKKISKIHPKVEILHFFQYGLAIDTKLFTSTPNQWILIQSTENDKNPFVFSIKSHHTFYVCFWLIDLCIMLQLMMYAQMMVGPNDGWPKWIDSIIIHSDMFSMHLFCTPVYGGFSYGKSLIKRFFPYGRIDIVFSPYSIYYSFYL